VEFGFGQDDLRLLSAFGDQVGIALDQARLLETEIEKQRLEKEFDVARRIQQSLLPTAPPAGTCFDVAGVSVPATEVGGDYFDYVRFANGNPGIIIADVSGKGVPAALYMATLKGAVLADMRLARGPADLLKRLHATLSGSMERRTFITIACVEVDRSCTYVRIARAGHTPVIVRTSGEVRSIKPSGLALGIVDQAQFEAKLEEVEVPIIPGDICLLSTDGVNERRNAQLQELQYQPVEEMLASAGNTSASRLVQRTQSLLDAHGQGTEQHDDVTIVAAVFGEPLETNPSRERTAVGTGVPL
jgi:serine phosphatase RsbU (regulator of sigma subunit)